MSSPDLPTTSSDFSDGGPEVMRGVVRAVMILEYLASQGKPCGLSNIARSTELSKPVVIRILRTWMSLGYVTAKQGNYELGWRIFTLAAARGEVHNLQAAARRYMQDLNEQTGETVHLSILAGHEVIYADKVEGRQAIRVYTWVGRRGPVHATASGKALLAYLKGTFFDDVVAGGLPALTDHTLTSQQALEVDLEETRQRGFSINSGEWHSEVGGVGAPVFDRDGSPEASLSITFPMSSADDERVRYLGGLVRDSAALLSKERGWVGGAK
jgi:DNA-binding IclR family transcriptional regulator